MGVSEEAGRAPEGVRERRRARAREPGEGWVCARVRSQYAYVSRVEGEPTLRQWPHLVA